MDDHTRCPCCKSIRCKNLWAYLFSFVIVGCLISQMIGQLKNMGSIIKLDSNKSYYQAWTVANKKFCNKFPKKIKGTYTCGKPTRYSMNPKAAYKKSDITEQNEYFTDPLIKVETPFDISIKTDKECKNYQLSLVLEPELVKKLGMKETDFKTYVFDGYKFEYDEDEGALGEDELGDYGFEDFGEEGYGDEYADYGDEYGAEDYGRLLDDTASDGA